MGGIFDTDIYGSTRINKYEGYDTSIATSDEVDAVSMIIDVMSFQVTALS